MATRKTYTTETTYAVMQNTIKAWAPAAIYTTQLHEASHCCVY